MEEFVLSPPSAVLYLAGAIVIVAIASIFLKKGEALRKAIGVGIVLVVAVALVIFLYRPTAITVSPDGVEVDGAGGLELAWDEVESAVYEPDLSSSPYRPTVRTRGVAVGPYRTGRFLLSNGDPARVFMEQSESAVVMRTSELTYVFAPADVQGLATAVDTYRVYEGDAQ